MVEKIKKFWNKYDSLIVIIFLIISSIGWCMDIYIQSKDELWNFMNICKMVNGYKMYQDANIITTPLFFFLGYIIFKIAGTNLLIFRLYNITIFTSMFFLMYLIMKKLCKNKFRALVYVLMILFGAIRVCTGGANYTSLALVWVLCGINYNLKCLERGKKNNIIQSILVFLVFITKQNIGVYYIIGIILYQIILNKKDIKNIFKQIFILGIEMLGLIFIFIYKGILGDFINMAILGLSEFAERNFSGSIFDILSLFLWGISVTGITIFLTQNEKLQKEEKQNFILLACITISMLLIEYPIFNDYHKKLSNMIITMFIFYVLDICVLRFLINKIKFIKIIVIIAMITCEIVSLSYFSNWTKHMCNDNKFGYSDYYFGGFFQNDEEFEHYEKIINYIKEQDKKVVIFSIKSAMYIIPLELNNGAMDLPLFRKYGERWRKYNSRKNKTDAKCTVFNFK